jgi:hypothetical protein
MPSGNQNYDSKLADQLDDHSCLIKPLSGLSTMMVRTPLAAMRSIIEAKPGRAVTGSAPFTAAS